MGEYFRVVNQQTMEYLDPFSMRSSEKIPRMLFSEDISRSIALLTCDSDNFFWYQLKNKTDRTKSLIGRWHGDCVDIVGDSRQEDLYQLTTETFDNISLDAFALLLELDELYMDELVQQIGTVHSDDQLIDKLLRMDEPPLGLTQKIASVFPNGWRIETKD